MTCFFAYFFVTLFFSQTDPWILVVESHPLYSAPGLGHREDQVNSLGLSLPWEQYTTAVCAILPFDRIINACGLPAALKSLPHCSNVKKGKEHFYSVIVEKITELLGERYTKVKRKTSCFRDTYKSFKVPQFLFYLKNKSRLVQSFYFWNLLLGKTPFLRTVCTDQDADQSSRTHTSLSFTFYSLPPNFLRFSNLTLD